MKYTRLNPQVRKQEILAAAVRISEAGDYATFTRRDLAKEAGCTPPLITRYFKNMDRLRDAIMQEAIRLPALRTVAQGLACGCPVARAAPPKIRSDALTAIT